MLTGDKILRAYDSHTRDVGMICCETPSNITETLLTVPMEKIGWNSHLDTPYALSVEADYHFPI
jgi:hypothetical protein